uniref:Uncharacterized protein n=1 Tax=viral metagenome TaxID=1070528 RepID=A0A6C0KVZ0_9ZZZZ
MNLIININQYDNNCVFFCEPIKNNIMNDGYFIRIIYSTSDFALNGITLLVHLNDVYCQKYYNKYKCTFNVSAHRNIIEQINAIEEKLLKSSNIKDKIPQYKIYEQLKNGNIKIFSDNIEKMNNNLFMLKISGIWETETQYGVTYKFMKINA